MAKRKSYNPFKMWGAYVGGILLVILIQLLAFRYCFETTSKELCNFFSLWINKVTTIGVIEGGLPMLLWFIVGFMLGWLIHSIIRKVS